MCFIISFIFGISNCIETSEILYVTTSIQIKFDTSTRLIYYIKMGPIIYEHIRYHFFSMKYTDLHHFAVH